MKWNKGNSHRHEIVNKMKKNSIAVGSCVLALFVFVLSIWLMASSSSDEMKLRSVKMPRVTTDAKDVYLCTSMEITEDLDQNFIVGFEPEMAEGKAHHMMVFICDQPAEKQDHWVCEHDSKLGLLQTEMICPGGLKEIYVWAFGIKEGLTLPEKTGFLLEKGKHVVIQVHYKDVLESPDNSGVNLKITDERLPQRAAIVTAGHIGDIPPKSTTYLDMICPIETNLELHPFVYGPHTHELGRIVTGYIVDGQTKEWTLLAKMDPRQPEGFYPNPEVKPVIQEGDILVARCTMVSDRNYTTVMGPRFQDEMCGFHVMYWFPWDSHSEEPKLPGPCISDSSVRWDATFGAENVPKDASEFNGILYVET